MAPITRTTSRRALTCWVLIASSLCWCAGCQSISQQNVKRIVCQRVCPVCKATSVDQCHCFQADVSAGYCQTNWVSLDPGFSDVPFGPVAPPYVEELPSEERDVEELPTPTALLSPQQRLKRMRNRRTRSVDDIAQTIEEWEFGTQSPSRSDYQGVSYRFDDEERPRLRHARTSSD